MLLSVCPSKATDPLLSLFIQETETVFQVFLGAVTSMGTERHAEIKRRGDKNEVQGIPLSYCSSEVLPDQTEYPQIVGCFCLTELSHGSNTQAVGTTATFDGGDIVLHTPHIGATKVWAGNLGE